MSGMSMVSVAGPSREERQAVQRRWVLVVCSVALAAILGFLWGARSSTTTITATAYVGDRIFSAQVDGTVYGASTSVAWYDAAGSFHERGWPECLTTVGVEQTVTFGGVMVTGPDGGGAMPHVAWVDCRPR